jgi:hypothetical protein
LPSLTLIRKDFDYSSKEPKIVLRTQGQADVDFITDFIRSVRRALQKQDDSAAMWGPRHELSNAIEKLTSSRKSIERQAGYLCKLLASEGISVSSERMTKVVVDEALHQHALKALILQEGGDVDTLTQKNAAISRVLQNTRRIMSRNEHVAREITAQINSYEDSLNEIERIVAQFERRISFKISASHVLKFFKLSTDVLTKMKKLVSLAVALKSGGASLLE